MGLKQFDELRKVTIEADYIHEVVIGGYKTIQMAVRTHHFLGSDIPNNANSRGFTGDKNRAVKEMIVQLKKEPEKFRFKNLGIRMVASEIIRNGNEITFYFDQEEGIFNGGHTYEVLRTYGNENAFVYVTVELKLPKERLGAVSIALNMSKKLESISQGEKMGAHQWIKDALPSESVIYKEGDQGEYIVTDILKVANLYRIIKGNKYAKDNFFTSLLRKGKIIKDNNYNQTLKYTQYLLPDLWYLYKELRSSEKIQSNLAKECTRGKKLLQGMALVFIYGCQYMTEINNDNIPVWKNGYNVKIALKTCEKLSKPIGKMMLKPPFDEKRTEWIYREPEFHDKLKRIFAEELMKQKSKVYITSEKE